MSKRMAIWIIVAGLLLLIGGIILLGYTAKGVNFAHLIAIFVVVAGIATLFKELGSSEKTDLIKSTGENTNNTVKELQIQNTGLLEKIESQAVLIEKLRQENAELRKDIKESHNYHTSGDSYCYLDFFPLPDKIEVFLHHVGKYPIKNLQIYLSNVSFFLDEKDDRRHYIAESTVRNTELISIPIVSVGFRNKIFTIPVHSTETSLFWVATFKTEDGLKKWFQRTVFKSYKEINHINQRPLFSEKILENHNFPHLVYTQVYDYIEENEPCDFKVHGTNQVIRSATTKVQKIKRERMGPVGVKGFDWINIHIGYNEQSFFQKVIYLEGAKNEDKHRTPSNH